MSVYKGFITRVKYKELKELVRHIGDVRGLENKIVHLYSPDTDMNDKICENFEISKVHILLDIYRMTDEIKELAAKIANLKES